MNEPDTIAMLRYRLRCADAHIARLEQIIALIEAGVPPTRAERVAEILRAELAHRPPAPPADGLAVWRAGLADVPTDPEAQP